MTTPANLEKCFRKIEAIRYENEHGGAYAYLQFLAYTRELVKILRPLKKAERYVDAIEGINWLFNEYLAAKFTHRQQSIFETKRSQAVEMFDALRLIIQEQPQDNTSTLVHRQAA